MKNNDMDTKIIDTILKHRGISQYALVHGYMTDYPASSIYYRLKKLKEDKLIRSEHYIGNDYGKTYSTGRRDIIISLTAKGAKLASSQNLNRGTRPKDDQNKIIIAHGRFMCDLLNNGVITSAEQYLLSSLVKSSHTEDKPRLTNIKVAKREKWHPFHSVIQINNVEIYVYFSFLPYYVKRGDKDTNKMKNSRTVKNFMRSLRGWVRNEKKKIYIILTPYNYIDTATVYSDITTHNIYIMSYDDAPLIIRSLMGDIYCIESIVADYYNGELETLPPGNAFKTAVRLAKNTTMPITEIVSGNLININNVMSYSGLNDLAVLCYDDDFDALRKKKINNVRWVVISRDDLKQRLKINLTE